MQRICKTRLCGMARGNKFSFFLIQKSKYGSPNQCSHSLFQYPDDCVQMWCLRKDGRTETNRAPWVDGTPCADGKICQHQKCV